MPRSSRITDGKMYGHTQGCHGCVWLQNKFGPIQNHSEECRLRFAELMGVVTRTKNEVIEIDGGKMSGLQRKWTNTDQGATKRPEDERLPDQQDGNDKDDEEIGDGYCEANPGRTMMEAIQFPRRRPRDEERARGHRLWRSRGEVSKSSRPAYHPRGSPMHVQSCSSRAAA